MLLLNREFYKPGNISAYIENSMSWVIFNNQSILNTKEYWLFYYIKEDFGANFYALYNTDIDLDCFGFTVVQRNTRHAIEAYLDLVNLVNDPAYLTVLEYGAHKGRYDSRYRSNLGDKRYFSMSIKYEIATQKNKQSLPESLIQIATDNNNYIHPNVFMDIIGKNDIYKKESILRNLLSVNLYVFAEAYKLMLQKFTNGVFPVLGCNACNVYPQNCDACAACFEKEKARFQNLIENPLLYSVPIQTYYQYPPFFN